VSGATFAAGMAFAWTSPVESQIVVDNDGECTFKHFCVTKGEFAWIATCMGIGSLACGFFAGPLMSKVGRKFALLAYFVPLIGGWIMLTFARFAWMLYVGRLLLGIGIGGGGVIVPVYIGEMAQPSIRGKLLSYFQLMVTIGSLVTYVFGYYLDFFGQTLGSTIIVIIYAICILFVPETPSFYVSKTKITKAKKSLNLLRGKRYNTESELCELIEYHKSQERIGFSSIFKNSTNRKALFTSVGLISAFQLSGINAVLFYTASIFDDANINMDANLAAILVGFFIFVATLISTFLIDKLGRRILLLTSYSSMFVCFLCMAIYFQIQANNPDGLSKWSILPVIFLCLYVFMNSIGAAPVAFVMMGEIFAPNVKDVAAGISMSSNYAFSIVVTVLFPYANEAFGPAVVFFVFTVLIALSFFFVYLFVPETKGKTFEEIQQLLKGK